MASSSSFVLVLALKPSRSEFLKLILTFSAFQLHFYQSLQAGFLLSKVWTNTIHFVKGFSIFFNCKEFGFNSLHCNSDRPKKQKNYSICFFLDIKIFCSPKSPIGNHLSCSEWTTFECTGFLKNWKCHQCNKLVFWDAPPGVHYNKNLVSSADCFTEVRSVTVFIDLHNHWSLRRPSLIYLSRSQMNYFTEVSSKLFSRAPSLEWENRYAEVAVEFDFKCFLQCSSSISSKTTRCICSLKV